jgi:dedicator of cytokinesis protein 2
VCVHTQLCPTHSGPCVLLTLIDKNTYGLFAAIFNFKEKGKLCLELQVGEAIYIIKESGDWYFGCAAKNRDCHGIFPKSYVKIRESSIDKSG